MKKIIWFSLVLLFLLPFAFIVLLSLATNWRFPLLLPESISLETWRFVLSSGAGVGNSFILSLILSALVAFLATVVGFGIARTIAGHPRKQTLLTIAYFPYAFSPVVYAFCLNFLFIKLHLVGNLTGVILSQLIITFPFAVILLVQHWSTELLQLENVVYTLGGSPSQAFWKVILPLSKNMLWICFIQTFLISWFEYGLTSIIGLGKIPTMTMKIYQYIGESNTYVAALASCLLVFPPLILLWINQRFVFVRLEK